MLDLTYEHDLWAQNIEYVIGIDEVGRGPLAGPVVVGGVLLSKNHTKIEGINDSKKIQKKYLKNISEEIKTNCDCYGIGVGSVKLINEQGIIYALQHAMSFAIETLLEKSQINIKKSNVILLIDGLAYKDPALFSHDCLQLHEANKVIYQPKADSTIYSVAAASIIAKVYRDELMTKLAEKHPHYGWEQNAGYGTKIHREAIKQYGLTNEHRELFCRKVMINY